MRTFPEIDLFKEDFMQTVLCNILFYFAREHPNIAYKQVNVVFSLINTIDCKEIIKVTLVLTFVFLKLSLLTAC